MRQLRTVPLSMVVVLATAVMTAAVMTPRWEVGTAAAATPESVEAVFRDLPASVRAGDSLRVQVDVPDGRTCDGSITYRDNSVQSLPQVSESDGRCRWDIVVPDVTRRGEADISVAVRQGTDKLTVTATFDVGRRSDEVGLVLKSLPGSVRRNNHFSIRIDVPDKATCKGGITYEDGKTQALESRTEDNEQCRWDMTVPPDVDRGEATVSVTVTTPDGHPSTLITSFDVSRGNDEPDLLIAFQDLPTTVRRDGPFPIRLLVPPGAKCKGEVSFRSADNMKLDQISGEGGLCRWTLNVPKEAKTGDSRVSVTVSGEGKDSTISARVVVSEITDDVDAHFKDLPTSIRRGDDLDVRVSAPENSTCRGEVRFDDGGVAPLSQQSERKNRCLWSARVPTFTSRGTAIVWVLVDDHGVQTTLTANVAVEGREDEPVTAAWNSVPKQVQRGLSFDVVVDVATGSSCVGRITFTGGMIWTLGNHMEEDAKCQWKVDVPVHVSPGKAGIEVKVEKRGETHSLTADVDVKAPAAPTVTPSPSPTPPPAPPPAAASAPAAAPAPPTISTDPAPTAADPAPATMDPALSPAAFDPMLFPADERMKVVGAR